ncbi:MAG: hypothetical protein VX640_02105 [Pseudomonadota bacterium]|nr:hypothetical protein [Pseudomonadota bacterium]
MADGSRTPDKKNAPRIAYSGEEYGFGYEAAEQFVTHARTRGWVNDGGATHQRLDQEFRNEGQRAGKEHDFSSTQRLPLRAKEQALLAVKMGTADYAVVPFYSPYYGYDYETLRALSTQFGLLAVEQYEAYDKLCLAVYEPQVLDLVQSAHPGSGLSSLLKKDRRLWNDYSVRPDTRYPSVHDSGEQFRAGLEIDRSAQLMLRDRIDMVFCGPEAARRCKSRLDGLRAAGVEVAETLRSLEPHREMAKLARATLNPNRQTNTFFDPRDGKTHFVSTMNAEPQTAKLYGVILPFQIAMMAQDFTIIDDDIEDSETAKTRFFVVKSSLDKSLLEDALKTTDAKTRYWMNRLRTVAKGAIDGGGKEMIGAALLIGGLALSGVGAAGLAGWEGVPIVQTSAASEAMTNWFVLLGGLALALTGVVVRLLSTPTEHGVRLMLKFERQGTAAAIGDVENFLRNYGVRHQVVRMDEDSERDKPAPLMLDVEFEPIDFQHNFVSMFTRRLRGSVVNGALKKSFQRWKNRGVTILAAMPIERDASHEIKFQLPKHQRRSWYGDAVQAWVADFFETQFIRFSRVLLIYVLPAVMLGALAYWYYLRSGGQ